MRIGILTLQIHLYGITSLKEKRSLVKHLIHKIQAGQNISVAEVADQDDLSQTTLRIGYIANDAQRATSFLTKQVVNLNGNQRDYYLEDWKIEIL
ncbi:DUF503 domain-containing protein [Candidatus Acetothermia bacterium]|jgi:uncharacterized protein YlxP (DUF503 family)|nr:DUF503 domain-containing protein [Candidatus Acetothermia bacterium]MCI2426269.1 DUF503 domain-containing protein [Candidatus Acetothermia bacterium]MCI2427265.1 DUF503 domain-containing protein [Candidatus Acetothermia bacterium]MCI2428529.1 DUF503 domain-containing protein [Candidatus Acetothermia bacterium]